MVEIDDALKRIESEDYGFCEAIGEQIKFFGVVPKSHVSIR